MNSSLHEWLCHLEDCLHCMIRGVFRFLIEGLPKWIYRFLVETVGPVAVRFSRVVALAFIWLLVVFGPPYVCGFGGWWCLTSLTWMMLAIAGSIWGLQNIRKRNPAQRAIGAKWS
jgi:hypothetical protein